MPPSAISEQDQRGSGRARRRPRRAAARPGARSPSPSGDVSTRTCVPSTLVRRRRTASSLSPRRGRARLVGHRQRDASRRARRTTSAVGVDELDEDAPAPPSGGRRQAEEPLGAEPAPLDRCRQRRRARRAASCRPGRAARRARRRRRRPTRATTATATAAAAATSVSRRAEAHCLAQRVADAAHRVDQARLAARLGLAAQVADVDVERVRAEPKS